MRLVRGSVVATLIALVAVVALVVVPAGAAGAPMNPTAGPPATVITVSVPNCSSGTPAAVLQNQSNATIATGVVDGNAVKITVPQNTALGAYTVHASCFLYSSTVTFDPATFTVTASNVGALNTPGGAVTITAPSGTTLSGLTESAVPSNAPAGVTFPFGLLGFTVSGVSTGGTVQVTLALPADVTAYWKYHNGTFTNFTGATFSAGKVVLTLTDGGNGDEDGVANGTIVEPGAPASASTAATPVAVQPKVTG